MMLSSSRLVSGNSLCGVACLRHSILRATAASDARLTLSDVYVSSAPMRRGAEADARLAGYPRLKECMKI